MGGAASEVERRDHARHRRVGHLRPGEHPPDRPALRAAQRGEPALREGPGAPPGPHRRGPRGAADRRVGRRRAAARAGSTRAPNEPVEAGIAFRPAPGHPPAGLELDADEQRVAAGARSASPPSRRRRRCPDPGRRPAPRPLEIAAAVPRALVAIVPSWRRDLADRGGHRRGGRPGARLRGGPADAARTRRSGLAAQPARAARRRPRDAGRRRRGRGREPRAGLPAPHRDVRLVRTRRARGRRDRRGRATGHGPEPALAGSLDPSPGAAGQPGRRGLGQRSPRADGPGPVRGGQGLRTRRRHGPRVVAPGDRRWPAISSLRRGTGPPARRISTTSRASWSCWRPAWGSDRPSGRR